MIPNSAVEVKVLRRSFVVKNCNLTESISAENQTSGEYRFLIVALMARFAKAVVARLCQWFAPRQREMFLVVALIFLTAPILAESLSVEESGVLESTVTRNYTAMVRTRAGFMFFFSGEFPWIDVSTNGFAYICRLPIYCWPIEPLADGGFAAAIDTNHFVTKFNAQGTIDPSFSAPAFEPSTGLIDLTSQRDGKIVVASSRGDFPPSDYQGSGLFRLNADGSHDETFNVSGVVLGRKVLVQADGKIIVLTLRSVLRFMSDGSVDTSFHSAQFDNDVGDFGLQPDGKIIVIGGFSRVDGALRPYLARITASGFVDFSFGPVNEIFDNGLIGNLVFQSSGDMVILNGNLNRVRRYLKDGQLDHQFKPGDSGNRIDGVGVDRADRIYYDYGGNHRTFAQYSGRRRIRRSGAPFDQVLEQSAVLGQDASWQFLQTLPANSNSDILLPSVPGPGNAFFRTRATQ
jgi:uncharacterized delta-60 repeat protein